MDNKDKKAPKADPKKNPKELAPDELEKVSGGVQAPRDPHSGLPTGK